MDNKENNKIVIIVDAYSSGNVIAPAFNQIGYKCVHVQSRKNIPSSFLASFNPEDFFLSIEYSENETVDKLNKYDACAVIAGSETGIEIADHLADALGLLGNNPITSQTRRNKYLMQECLRKNSLNHIATYRITNTHHISTIVTEIFSQYDRLILKPVDSAGTDSVYICRTIEELIEHSESLLNKPNQLNLENKSLILQPFIDGQEYVVDTVSYNGEHKICAIWKMSKGHYNGADSICEFTELTTFADKELNRLKDYIFKCLDALDIKFGAAHSELFLTNDSWLLIETGARPHGGGFPALSSYALKRTQIDELVRSTISADLFLEDISDEYKPLQYLKIKELISYTSGCVESINKIDDILNLDSYKKSKLPNVGQKISVTIDVYSSPGWIALSNSSAEQLNNDYQYIVQVEKQGMFNVNGK